MSPDDMVRLKCGSIVALAGRLWEILFGAPGVPLDEAINHAKYLRENL